MIRKSPDKSHKAAEASRQVGAVDEIPRPTVAPNATKIDESAVAASAPRIAGVQVMYRAAVPAGAAEDSISVIISPKSKERQHSQDDDDQTDEID